MGIIKLKKHSQDQVRHLTDSYKALFDLMVTDMATPEMTGE